MNPDQSQPTGITDPPGSGTVNSVLRLVIVLALLYIFLFAIALLGAAFKVFGSDFSEALITTTTNPVVGLMIGLLATSLIQSSSSTTSIVVGMVAAGALTVTNAVPIIMGANMGTTVTNTIVAMTSMNRRSEFMRAFAGATMHDFFNLLTILILFPIEQATHYLERSATWLSQHLIGTEALEFHSPVKAAVKPVVNLVKHFLTETVAVPDWLAGTIMLVVSLGCIFFALTMLTKQMKHVFLRRAEGVLPRLVTSGGLTAMLMGVVITVSVQSSSITTSLLVPMIGAGIIPLESALAMTMGANVGTTVTALLASLAGNAAAVTVALVHLLFNISGILLIYPFRPIRRIPINLARNLAIRTARRRIFALIYMLGIFFALPLIFVFITKAIER